MRSRTRRPEGVQYETAVVGAEGRVSATLGRRPGGRGVDDRID